jgi:hypothetical protein
MFGGSIGGSGAREANVGKIVIANTKKNAIGNATTILVCFIFIFGASSITRLRVRAL